MATCGCWTRSLPWTRKGSLVTSARDPVGVSSQDARIDPSADDTPEDLARKVNDALVLVRDDIQRLAGLASKSVTTTMSSGNYRLIATASGLASVWAISDTTTVSTGANFYLMTLRRNGVTANTIVYKTANTEAKAYAQCFLGQVAVAAGDLLEMSLF